MRDHREPRHNGILHTTHCMWDYVLWRWNRLLQASGAMMAHPLNKRCGPFNSVMLGFLATRTGEAAKLACYKPSENQTEIAARKDIAWHGPGAMWMLSISTRIETGSAADEDS